MNTDYVKLLYQCKTHDDWSCYSEMEIIYLILLMISCVTILIFLFYSILVFDLLRDLAHLITICGIMYYGKEEYQKGYSFILRISDVNYIWELVLTLHKADCCSQAVK